VRLAQPHRHHTLVFGIALFLAYQLTHLGPIGKVLTGFAITAALLAGGLWLERKPQYTIFARAASVVWRSPSSPPTPCITFPATQVLSNESPTLYCSSSSA